MIEQVALVPSSVVQPRLFEDLVQETHELLQKKRGLEGAYIETIIRIGQNLNEMQSDYSTRQPYGRFTNYAKEEFRLSERTIQVYRNIASVYAINPKRAAHFPERILAVLSAPSTDEEVRKLVESGKIPATREAIRDANRARKAMKKVEQWEPEASIVESTIENSEVIEKQEDVDSDHELPPIYHCPIAKLHEHVEANSVDVIITDPPYPREFLYVYDDLAQFAIHALKDGGSLITMIGQSYLPEILDMLRKEPLTYHWFACYYITGYTTKQWQRNIGIAWKPLLWFVKGKYTGPWRKDADCYEDTFDTKNRFYMGQKKDKKYHEWGQPESDMANIIERFTQEGQLICDPFVGGGSTAVAALDRNRRFVGGDIDEGYVLKTRKRLDEAVASREEVSA